LVAGVLVAAPAAASTSCQVPDGPASAPAHPSQHTTPVPAGPGFKVGGDDGDVAFKTDCDGPAATNVSPDTPAARRAASRRCAVIDDGITNAQLPDGWHPIDLDDALGGGQ
jgi:hypothetical protein